MRLHARRSDQTSPATQSWAWARADALSALAGPRVAAFNEGLMELGALVCTPDSPRCDRCPLARRCETHRFSLQDIIPRPKRAAPVRQLVHTVVLARDLAGRVLIEQRPDTGLWAGLWQAPTIETSRSGLPSLNRWLRSPSASAVFGGPLRKLTTFQRTLSHRRVDLRVWSVRTPLGRAAAAKCRTAPLNPGGALPPGSRVWKSPDEIERLALSVPQRHILLTLAPEAFTD
jgi:A/G-specific adenine glycosylase